MPRQDVPYGGAICRLKERIAEIWDKLGEKLHSINGVEGDAAGDVKIVSGDAVIVVTSDQVNHEIEIALDSSQLPAASVSSVNGQTGTVALTADDIPSDNGDVQTDLDTLAGADITLQGNINAEALARQNADSTLQTNINNISAGLPAAAAAAVAADPTVAQLTNDVTLLQNTAQTSSDVQTALNNYAPMVRIVNNQMNIRGNKGFQTEVFSLIQRRITTGQAMDICEIPFQYGQTHNVNVIFSGRYGVGVARIAIQTSSNTLTSINVDALDIAATRILKFGARGENDKIIVFMFSVYNNCNLAASVLSSNYGAGIILDPNIENYGNVSLISNMANVVTE